MGRPAPLHVPTQGSRMAPTHSSLQFMAEQEWSVHHQGFQKHMLRVCFIFLQCLLQHLGKQ